MENRPRYRVPDELRETLLDFTIAYLLERPTNLASFGLSFFQRLKDEREGRGPAQVTPAAVNGGAGGGGGPATTPDELEGRGREAEIPLRQIYPGPSPAPAPVAAGQGHLGHPQPQHHDQAQRAQQGPQNVAINQVARDVVRRSLTDAHAHIREAEQEPHPPVRAARRKSVFAEAYNPEEDEDDKPSVVHPKSDSQRARLAEAVKHSLLFRSLDGEQMHEVLDAMFERKVAKGEYVIKQGEDGDNFYVIEAGKYKVYVQAEGEAMRAVGGYQDSGSFGELALMYNMPRAATVQAESEGSLWAMDRQTFRRIVLKNAFRKRQMYEALLDAVPMLKTLENYERMNLADALVPRTYTNGQAIIRQGDAADGMYFMEDGTVRVVRLDQNGQEKELTRTSKGGYFGELALLTSKPRAATVIAVDNVKVAFLDVEAFERLLGPCMEIMKRNAEGYEKQLIQIFGSKSNITDIRWN